MDKQLKDANADLNSELEDLINQITKEKINQKLLKVKLMPLNGL